KIILHDPHAAEAGPLGGTRPLRRAPGDAVAHQRQAETIGPAPVHTPRIAREGAYRSRRRPPVPAAATRVSRPGPSTRRRSARRRSSAPDRAPFSRRAASPLSATPPTRARRTVPLRAPAHAAPPARPRRSAAHRRLPSRVRRPGPATCHTVKRWRRRPTALEPRPSPAPRAHARAHGPAARTAP